MGYFRIEQGHEPAGVASDKGRTFAQQGAPPREDRTYPVVLRCYNDDKELAYTVGCSDERAAEDAFDWTRWNVGCTYSTVSKRGQPAKPFIG